MAIDRLQVAWSAATVGPGVSTFYATPGGGVRDDIELFFSSLTNIYPSPGTWSVPGTGDTIDEADGALIGTWTTGPPDELTGTAGPQRANGVGACITWKTDTIVRGRRVQGRTFFVPLATTGYDSAGTIAEGTRSALSNAAQALVSNAGGALVVWSRPTLTGQGVAAPVVAVQVADQVSVLRSRRF